MLLRLPSLQHHYDEFFSGDDAFAQPPPFTGEHATPEEREAWSKAIAEYLGAIEHARHTGKWDALRIAGGEPPTRFVLRPIDGNVMRRMADDSASGRLGDAEARAIAFRLAFVDVAIPGLKTDLKPVRDDRYGTLAHPDIVAQLDRIHPDIVSELGRTVIQRAQGVLPLF